MSVTLHHGDMLAVLPTLEASSFAACVCDPPYMIEFMGKAWDRPGSEPSGLSPFEAWFAGFAAGEGCFRIQAHKDGRYYTCAFSIHLRADDAPVLRGLQTRIGGRLRFGDERKNKQGVRSSPDVRWIIETREDCWKIATILDRMPLFAKKANDYRIWRRALQIWTDTPKGNRWHGARDVAEIASLHEKLKEGRRYDADAVDVDVDPFMPPAQAFHYRWAREVHRVLKPGAFLMAFAGSRTFHRVAVAIEDAGFVMHPFIGWVTGSGFPKGKAVPSMEGWRYGQQAMKPAIEPILVAQKPYEGKPVDSIRKHGCGAFNIDGCRIEAVAGDYDHPGNPTLSRMARHSFQAAINGDMKVTQAEPHAAGRYPANLIHDGSEAVLAEFAKAGTSVTGRRSERSRSAEVTGTRFMMNNHKSREYPGDTGTAARFFNACPYEPEDFPAFIYEPKVKGGEREAYNTHPTLKPIRLLQHLIRLTVRPGERVLDPFAGSGSTLLAAMREGVEAVGVELEAEHVEIARRRIAEEEKQPDLLAGAA